MVDIERQLYAKRSSSLDLQQRPQTVGEKLLFAFIDIFKHQVDRICTL